MTNEEKAKKIVWNLCDDGLFYHKYESQRQEIQSALVNMAEWKDGQKEAEKEALISKACEWLRNNIESDKYLSPDEESYRMGCGVDYLETNMFIEDFKNYMKGGDNE